ncbi:hypothetical protein R3P38DRAFT_3351587 [Favolaschia claudopus]|uniref:Uncharacterized protein n=1 Tax=Favolaschia claudopus TaxID=2862362 RepID=A0AAW0C5E4_9AGAR
MSRDRVGCLFIFISLRLSIAPFKLVLFETTGDPRGKAAGGTIPRFGASEAQIPRVKRPHNDSPPTSQLHFAAHGASAQSAVQLDSDYSAAVVAHQFFPTPVLFGLAIFYDLSPLHLYKRSLGQGSFDYEVPSFEALQLLAARDFLYASGLNVDPDRVRVLVTRPRGHRTDAIAAVMGYLSLELGVPTAKVLKTQNTHPRVLAIWKDTVSEECARFLEEVCHVGCD